MRSIWSISALVVLPPLLLGQDAVPVSTSQTTLSGCDLIAKQMAQRVSGGRLLHKVAPKYPKAARKAQSQGTVRLSSTIAKDGTVQNVTVIEGDPTLAAAAADAVKQWRYDAFKLNESPVEVANTVVVNFTAQGRVEVSSDVATPRPTNPASENAANPPVVSSDLPYPVYESLKEVKPPKATFMPNPTYTKSARKARTQGTVVLGFVVTPEGTTRDIEVCKSLDSGLDQRAVEVLSRWRFDPATKDGKPVAVRLRTEVTFRLF
jgi:TonB family protein